MPARPVLQRLLPGVRSDSVYLRALIGSVAIGIGQDGGESLQREFFRICKIVTEWIGSGGGPV